jgi:Do/DeqQ family serine protease
LRLKTSLLSAAINSGDSMRAHRYLIPTLCLLAACSQPGAQTSAQTLATQSLPAPPLAEPARKVPADAASMRLSFAPIVRRVAPAVVNVYSRRVVRQSVDPFWQMFGGGIGAPRERVAQSLGSGVVVRADGVIVTNNHVIEGGQEIVVVLSDRREFPAKVLHADPRADIAVLKIEVGNERLPVLALDDHDDAQVGDLVLAIGDPFGVGQTVTNGIVSALARSDVGITDVSYFIQTDAAINPGNSGGALVDMDGNMIGMNSAILSQSGTSSGVGFAIPAALVKRVVETAVGGASAASARPWLGLKTQGVTAEIARSLGLDRPQGVLVTDVYPGGPAARAGLKQGDLVLSIEGQPVIDESSLNYRVATRRSGDTLALSVRHEKGAARTVHVRLEAPPAEPARDERLISGRNPLSGATVVNLSPAVADELGVDPFAVAGGVMVTKIGPGFAANAGIQPGDIIRQVNGQPVKLVRDLQTLLAGGGHLWTIAIQRGQQVVTAQFRL